MISTNPTYEKWDPIIPHYRKSLVLKKIQQNIVSQNPFETKTQSPFILFTTTQGTYFQNEAISRLQKFKYKPKKFCLSHFYYGNRYTNKTVSSYRT